MAKSTVQGQANHAVPSVDERKPGGAGLGVAKVQAYANTNGVPPESSTSSPAEQAVPSQSVADLVEQCREALAVTVNMTVAIETICAAAKHCDALEMNGLLDAILACLETIQRRLPNVGLTQRERT